MRSGLRAFALVVGALLAPISSLAQVEWNHNPASGIGPDRWGSLTFPFATCGSQFDPVLQALQPAFVEVGKKQTPINILTQGVIPGSLPALVPSYQPTPFIVENTGHVVEVPVAPGTSSIFIGGDRYELLQFHLHAPSEHRIDGQFAAAELHLVHRNALSDLAVVGVLVQVGTPINTAIDTILKRAPLVEGELDLGGAINPRDVLPAQLNYYTYSGSLTTPPCSEGVRWFVLPRPVFVTAGAINQFHAVISRFPGYAGYPDNNRPVRPLNGRTVFRN